MSLQFPSRLRSRKFWAMIAGLLYFIMNNDVNQALGLLVAYIGAQGAVDFKHGSPSTPITLQDPMSHNIDTPDTGPLVTGSGRIAPFDEQPPATTPTP